MSGTTRFSDDRRACKVINRATGGFTIIHSAITTEEDSEYEWDPDWLGPTPNGYQWGYCIRCGQPFHWVCSEEDETDFAILGRIKGNWGWIEVSHEEVRAAYAEWLQNVRDEAISDIHTVRELVK